MAAKKSIASQLAPNDFLKGYFAGIFTVMVFLVLAWVI
jgi:hypothetical protein